MTRFKLCGFRWGKVRVQAGKAHWLMSAVGLLARFVVQPMICWQYYIAVYFLGDPPNHQLIHRNGNYFPFLKLVPQLFSLLCHMHTAPQSICFECCTSMQTQCVRVLKQFFCNILTCFVAPHISNWPRRKDTSRQIIRDSCSYQERLWGEKKTGCFKVKFFSWIQKEWGRCVNVQADKLLQEHEQNNPQSGEKLWIRFFLQYFTYLVVIFSAVWAKCCIPSDGEQARNCRCPSFPVSSSLWPKDPKESV